MSTTGALDRVAEAVRAASGICVRPHQYDSLAAAFARSIGPLDSSVDSSDLYRALKAGGAPLDRLVDEVAVKETTFFRDRQQLDAIDWQELLRSAHRRHHEICVWSAGCATGEEAYSVAILACEAFATREPPVRIVGTDLSETAVATARSGRYRERALREVDNTLRDRYFTHDGHGYLVNERLRTLVTFQKHNMVTDLAPPAEVDQCSVIICRNVFIYFETSTAEKVMTAFRRSLADDGIVILGAADALVRVPREPTGRVPVPVPRGVARRRDATRVGDHRTSPAFSGSRVGPISTDQSLGAALDAASRGRHAEAIERADAVLGLDPFNSHALFVRGFIELVSGRPDSAIPSIRAALYADPTFGLAAFVLGRAHDACGDEVQARRAYEQSLRVLVTSDRDRDRDRRHDYLLAQVDIGDVIAACRVRLAVAT